MTTDFPTPTLALPPLRRKAEQQGSREFSPHWVAVGREMLAETLTRALVEAAFAG
jgi:hypothetical protein